MMGIKHVGEHGELENSGCCCMAYIISLFSALSHVVLCVQANSQEERNQRVHFHQDVTNISLASALPALTTQEHKRSLLSLSLPRSFVCRGGEATFVKAMAVSCALWSYGLNPEE